MLKTSLSDKNEAELKATLSTHSRSEAAAFNSLNQTRGTRCSVSF